MNNNVLAVLPTKTPHRKYAKGDYVISIHKKTKKELKIGMFAVVGYKVNYFGSDECKKGLLKNKVPLEQELKIHARVIGVDDHAQEGMRTRPDEIRVDQTIRNAIGIPYSDHKEEVSIYPVKMAWHKYVVYFIRYFVTRKLGFRYLYYRVCSAHIHDMEKGIVRIPKHTFPILGTNVKNKVVFENPEEREKSSNIFEIKTRSITTQELTNDIRKLRIKLEQQPEIRYRNPLKWIRVEPDISRVFIDQADRERLGVDQLYPVKARRDVFDLFKSQILAVGIFFLISLVSIGGLIPLERSWTNFIVTLLSGSLISIILVIVLLRSQIK
ncbi:hypothetical protein GWO43_04595 [candidate division KSB1 bacterium]|nr:hypothetical protein [candidate division KSB1 bacterium]NIR71168.1 hypothetical protein [candidate division KSB1 bacterium]NIS23298.1 hypothetical protein [candidate division KSB1 bacterium]NIT70177.1 hypothetical protein [candidate division KSB1 bacterium]NIU23828.1 hypothetical protein [candidate division KSB1 bacterium]